ncbi:MAG: hypothetical protein MUP02_11465, partial [Actinobacteria bacterium]|nr:hypothetical protein [Actinomycetota bacterium]
MLLLIIVIISTAFCNTPGESKNISEQQIVKAIDADASSDSTSESSINQVKLPSHFSESFRYDLNNPDNKYILPNKLEEISGLAYYTEDKILCVQDEEAKIFVLDLIDGKIMNKYDFGENGDYEGIAFDGKKSYIIR